MRGLRAKQKADRGAAVVEQPDPEERPQELPKPEFDDDLGRLLGLWMLLDAAAKG